jgi:hypothetical protein
MSLSILKRDQVYLIQLFVLKLVSDLGRSVIFSRQSGFLHQYKNWQLWYKELK